MSEENLKPKNVFELKVNGKHPAKKFQLGRHTIVNTYKKYELNDAEKKELQTDGPKKWIEIKK